jgi:hypothetical protein
MAIENAVDGIQNGRGRPEEVLTAVTAALSFQKLHRELLERGAQHGPSTSTYLIVLVPVTYDELKQLDEVRAVSAREVRDAIQKTNPRCWRNIKIRWRR